MIVKQKFKLIYQNYKEKSNYLWQFVNGNYLLVNSESGRRHSREGPFSQGRILIAQREKLNEVK